MTNIYYLVTSVVRDLKRLNRMVLTQSFIWLQSGCWQGLQSVIQRFTMELEDLLLRWLTHEAISRCLGFSHAVDRHLSYVPCRPFCRLPSCPHGLAANFPLREREHKRSLNVFMPSSPKPYAVTFALSYSL